MPVTNLAQSTAWITSVFGALETMVPAEEVIEFQLTDQVWLQIFEQETIANQSVLRLEVEDVVSAYEQLKDKGIQVFELETVPDVVSVFEFADPDGNRFSFYQLR